jgi:DNA-binding transcriptional LysR family regulator
MLSLNLLRVFNAVAEHKNVILAAGKLYISQPAVSAALKKLQNEMDVRLFLKSGRNLVLTEQGIQFYELTQRIFNTEREIEALIAQFNSLEKQFIHVGLVSIYER